MKLNVVLQLIIKITVAEIQMKQTNLLFYYQIKK